MRIPERWEGARLKGRKRGVHTLPAAVLLPSAKVRKKVRLCSLSSSPTPPLRVGRKDDLRVAITVPPLACCTRTGTTKERGAEGLLPRPVQQSSLFTRVPRGVPQMLAAASLLCVRCALFRPDDDGGGGGGSGGGWRSRGLGRPQRDLVQLVDVLLVELLDLLPADLVRGRHEPRVRLPVLVAQLHLGRDLHLLQVGSAGV